jgi:hypothetical protein
MQMAPFADMRVRPHPVGGNIMSGDRMMGMNRHPGDGEFLQNPGPVLWTLVVRTIHRHINDRVFRAFDLVSTAPMDPRTLAVPALGNNFRKEDMSRQFLHNSQRAYWSENVTRWAILIALPVAQSDVIQALSVI